MRVLKLLILALAVGAPIAANAFSNDNAAVNRAINDHQAAMADYAGKRNQPVPAVMAYQYGMKLDVAKVVKVSPELWECKVTPRLMTYEDSSGKLNTLQYQMMSGCRGKN